MRNLPRLLLLLLLFASSAAARSPGLLLTEFAANPAGDDSQREWVELTNFSDTTLALADYKLGDEETPGGNEGFYRFPATAVVGSEEVIVVAQTAVGFRQLFGQNPTFEFQDSDPAVPDMRPVPELAQGEFGLANGGDELLLLGADDTLLDSLSYGESTHTFNPPLPNPQGSNTLSRIPASCATQAPTQWRETAPNPFSVDTDGECAPRSLPELPTIGDVQGIGDNGSLLNQAVSVRATVIGLHADRNASGLIFYTIYVQEAAALADGDPRTSDGLPVFLGTRAPQVAIGDEVLVSGVVTEFFGLTELDDQNLRVERLGSGAPVAAEPFDPGWTLSDLESREGMLVEVEAGIVAGPTFETPSGCGLTILPGAVDFERPIQHTGSDPLPPLLPILFADESSCAELPVVKTGDRIVNLSGPLTYNFDEYKLILQDPAAVVVEPTPFPSVPQPPELQAGEISIATFNVENHFDAIDDTFDAAEPKPTAVEIEQKEAKLAFTIAETLGCPTLLAIQEVEKASLLEALADRLNEPCGFRYTVSHVESFDVRGIDNALLANPQRVTIERVRLQQACAPLETGLRGFSCPAGEAPLFSRPPLEVSVRVDDQPLTLYVNHFKSKRGEPAETALRRRLQAEHQRELVGARLAEDPQAQIIVLGDFNDYAESEGLQILTAGGELFNALQRLPRAERFSFNFGGVGQLIDGILLSPATNGRFVSATIQHVNADYPDVYTFSEDPEHLPYRSADHDPSLVVLDWGQEEEVDLVAQGEQQEPSGDGSPTAVPPTLTPTAAPADAPTSTPWLSYLLWGCLGGLLSGLFFAAFALWLRRRAR